MAPIIYNAEAATVDTAFTTGNKATVQAGTVQWDMTVGATSSIMARNAASGVAGLPIHGTKSYDIQGAAGEVCYLIHTVSGTPTQIKCRIVDYIPALPTSADLTLGVAQTSGGAAMLIVLTTTGRIRLQNANAGTTVWASNATTGLLAAGDLVTWDWDLDVGTTGSLNTGDGTARLKVYKHSVSTSTPFADSSTSAEWQASGPVNNNFFKGTGPITQIRWGKQTTGTGAFRIGVDSASIDYALGLQGTVENPIINPPILTSPAAQSKLTGDTATLSMGVVDPQGGTPTHSWVTTSKPATAGTVTFSPGSTNATPTTSALTVDGTYVFTDTVNNGVTASATATVYVAPADGSSTSKGKRAGTSWTGTAADINNASDTDYWESPVQPAASVVIDDRNPIKPGDVAPVIRMEKAPAGGAAVTVLVDIIQGATDTVITAVPRSINLTDTWTNYPITLTGGEQAAFTNHNVWGFKVTATE